MTPMVIVDFDGIAAHPMQGPAIPSQVDAARGHHVDYAQVAGAPRGGGSSWQSLTRGTGSIEADFLNGEVVLLGREHGVPVPVNEALQGLANRAAADRLPPGSLSPEEIFAAAGASARDR